MTRLEMMQLRALQSSVQSLAATCNSISDQINTMVEMSEPPEPVATPDEALSVVTMGQAE